MTERRSLLQWVLWDRRHLALAGAGALGVSLFFMSCGSGDTGPEAESTVPVESPQPTSLPPVESPLVVDLAPPSPTTTGDIDESHDHAAHDDTVLVDPMASVAAEGFVRRWLDVADPDWPDVGEFAVEDLATALAAADPADVPTGEVADSQILTSGLGYSEVAVLIGDDQTVTVVLTTTADGWKVTEILP